jgi:hypothetical protein
MLFPEPDARCWKSATSERLPDEHHGGLSKTRQKPSQLCLRLFGNLSGDEMHVKRKPGDTTFRRTVRCGAPISPCHPGPERTLARGIDTRCNPSFASASQSTWALQKTLGLGQPPSLGNALDEPP